MRAKCANIGVNGRHKIPFLAVFGVRLLDMGENNLATRNGEGREEFNLEVQYDGGFNLTAHVKIPAVSRLPAMHGHRSP